MWVSGFVFDFINVYVVGVVLVEVILDGMMVGVLFLFLLYVELLKYWIVGMFLVLKKIDICMVLLFLMVWVLVEGEIDVFCVGEFWGLVVVE